MEGIKKMGKTKMKKFLVSFANKDFYEKQKILNESALKFGINETFSYTGKMLKETLFYEKNRKILDKKRGAGYWIWKPYIILDAMEKINEGDIIFYVDSGAEIISDVQPLIDLCKKQDGILLFNGVNISKFWTKRDCFIKMDCDNEKYWNALIYMGGYQIYIKNEKSIKFLRENLKYVQFHELVDDSPSISPNFPGFMKHLWDQCVLTNLAVKYNISKGFRNPSQGGNHLKTQEFREKGEWLSYPYSYSRNPDKSSNYPTIFYNRRNAGWLRIFLINLHSKFPIKLKKFLISGGRIK